MIHIIIFYKLQTAAFFVYVRFRCMQKKKSNQSTTKNIKLRWLAIIFFLETRNNKVNASIFIFNLNHFSIVNQYIDLQKLYTDAVKSKFKVWNNTKSRCPMALLQTADGKIPWTRWGNRPSRWLTCNTVGIQTMVTKYVPRRKGR